MLRTKKFAVIALASALSLAACSDDSDSGLEGKQPGTGTSTEEGPDNNEGSGDQGGENGETGETGGADENGETGTEEPETGGSANEIDVAPATGPQAQHADYTLTLPEGWEEFPEGEAPDEFEIVAADSTAEGDFANNINILSASTEGFTLDDIEGSAAAELEQVGATDVKIRDRVVIAGGEVVRVSAHMSQMGDYDIEQFYLTNGDLAKIATISTGADVSEEERETLALSIMATWNWN